MSFIGLLSALPVDLGQGRLKHSTMAKQIAWVAVPEARTGGTALDIGCGDGYWSDRLKSKHYTVTSIDIPREYPNEDWDAPYPETKYIDAGKKLPFQDNTFDLVWSTEVIEHVQDFRTMLSEIDRTLAPGGQAVVTTPNSFFWLHYVLALFGMKNEDWQNTGHVHFFSRADVGTFFPGAVIYGYFPYTLIKLRISKGTGLLSPSFVILYRKPNLAPGSV